MSETIENSNNKKQRLGRGLGSLLGGQPTPEAASQQAPPQPINKTINVMPTSTASTQSPNTQSPTPSPVPPESRIWKMAIDKIRPGVYQPRTSFDKEKLQELATSIKQNGILQPIVVRKLANGAFEIIAGERRWRAAQLAGLHEVPAIIKNLDDRATLQMSLIENIQREDLNPIEEAEAYRRLVEEFNLTQQQVAERVGKERATVANSLRLLSLEPTVRQMLVNKEISQGHAKVLLSVADPKTQRDFAQKVARGGLSVRKLEKLISSGGPDKFEEFNPVTSALSKNVTDQLISSLSDELQKIMGTKVSIDYSKSAGKIAIHFYSDEELTNLVEKLKESWQRP